ncbi:hypothetical protein GN244_ATG16189 [Phytophthora infestans]|uniref:Uncharacterized protein n=1 Tax=Phytophthora infestans TaxID=4787 RepID=A0A833SIL5_PHYIN|nr:hypothetical protein GN244_ATG16189 [Phytophthora infestans]
MEPDVSVNTGHGFDRLLLGWKALSRCYPGLDLKLIRLENGWVNSLHAFTKATTIITEDTLPSVLPHLVDINNAREYFWAPNY